MAKMVESLTVNSRESLAGDLKTYVSTSLENSLAPIKTCIETIRAALDSHSQKITTMDNTLTTHSDELAGLTTRMAQLEKANAALASKAEDHKNRSRRKNLRLVNRPEGAEGGSPVDFVSQLLYNVIGDEIFPKPPELDLGATFTGSRCQIPPISRQGVSSWLGQVTERDYKVHKQ